MPFVVAAPGVRPRSVVGPGWPDRQIDRSQFAWDDDRQPYWEGEVEPCINGGTVTNGVYFGVDSRRSLKGWWASGSTTAGGTVRGCNGSVRSSFASTINVLEGLLEYERVTGGTPQSQAARNSGEEYLLKRHLF